MWTPPGRYDINPGHLHQEYSRLGLCGSFESVEQYILETADYIRDAEESANVEEIKCPQDGLPRLTPPTTPC